MDPILPDFDLSAVPSLRFLRSMRPEIRGVIENLHDSLKELRTSVFRCGEHVLSVEEIARQAWLEAEVLTRTLPDIITCGFMARDGEGGLFSPVLYARELRKRERAEERAFREARQEHLDADIAAGHVPAGTTLKTVTNQRNGLLGGRPRKGETREQARTRRETEVASLELQRHMPLLRKVVTSETQNPNRSGFQELGSVGFPRSRIEDSISNSSCSLDWEGENTRGTETQNPKATIPDALVHEAAKVVLEASGLGAGQSSYAGVFARKWLQAGATVELIHGAIRQHCADMEKNSDRPRTVGVFDAPVRRQISVRGIQEEAQQRESQAFKVAEDERPAREAYSLALRKWKEVKECDGFKAADRKWPEIIKEIGLPEGTRMESGAFIAAFHAISSSGNAAVAA